MSHMCSLPYEKMVFIAFQTLEEDKHGLSLTVQDLQRQLQEMDMSRHQEQQNLLKLQDSIGSKLTELYETHEIILATIKQESNS